MNKKQMIQNDRRRTNSAIDRVLVVNESITTPNFRTLDLTVLRSFTLGPDVVFNNGGTSIGTNNISTVNITTNEITTTEIHTTTLQSNIINTTNVVVADSATANQLILLANSEQIAVGNETQTVLAIDPVTQIAVGNPNRTILDIDTSASRTVRVPPTDGKNANIVLTEGAQTINGVKTFTDIVIFLSSFSIASLALTAVTNQLTLGTGQTVRINAPTPAASRTYTMPDVMNNASFVMTEGAQTLNGVKTFSATAVFLAGFSLASLTLSAVANQLILGAVNTITVNAPTPAASRTYTMPDVLNNASFVMTEGAQTLNGVKTFSSTAVFLSGFSLASLTLSAVSNQLTLGAGNTITLTAPTPAASRTYTIPDSGTNASFVMTEGAQSISGAKLFFNNMTLDALLILNNTTQIQFSKPTDQMTFTTGGQTVTLNVAGSAANRTYTVSDAGASANFVMTEGTQNINGTKRFFGQTTFESTIIVRPASNQIILGGVTAITINAQTPVIDRTYTIPDVLSNASFILSEGTQTINGVKTFTSAPVFSGLSLSFAAGTLTNTTNQLVLGTTNTTTINSVAPTASRTYTIPDAGANANVILSESNVARNINGTINIGGLMRVVGNSFQIFPGGLGFGGFNISAPFIPASTRTVFILDAGADSSFILSEGVQTINGQKTLTNARISFPTIGGTPSELDFYQYLPTSIDFFADFYLNPPTTVGVWFVRVGAQVTMFLDGFTRTPQQGPLSDTIDSTTAIPAQFRPIHDAQFRITSVANGVPTDGVCVVFSTGFIEISTTFVPGAPGQNQTFAFASPSGPNGFRGFSASWIKP